MATRAAHKRLTREYKTITENPPPYISAHPSETNILEWHYILTGPPSTPYVDGQYWGTLIFPPDYPFAPPAIRMHTPSGRFQPSTRLCLSISDFHPKSFNPAWEVSTILLGLQSFMTSEEMTTGSLSASDAERRVFAARSRWWNSTAGGAAGNRQRGGGGANKFRDEWPEEDELNWKWMEEHSIDPASGRTLVVAPAAPAAGKEGECSGHIAGLRKRPNGSGTGLGDVVQEGGRVREAGETWFKRNRLYIALGVLFGYALLARLLGETQ